MKPTKFILIFFTSILLLLIVFLGCYFLNCGFKKTKFMPKSKPRQEMRMPNPAAVFCVKKGYKYEIKKGPNGQEGICIFPDGQSCHAWAFYRGECGRRWKK